MRQPVSPKTTMRCGSATGKGRDWASRSQTSLLPRGAINSQTRTGNWARGVFPGGNNGPGSARTCMGIESAIGNDRRTVSLCRDDGSNTGFRARSDETPPKRPAVRLRPLAAIDRPAEEPKKSGKAFAAGHAGQTVLTARRGNDETRKHEAPLHSNPFLQQARTQAEAQKTHKQRARTFPGKAWTRD